MATLQEAIERESAALMDIPGVVGVGQGRTPDGLDGIIVMLAYASDEALQRIPDKIDDYPVVAQVTGEFQANAS